MAEKELAFLKMLNMVENHGVMVSESVDTLELVIEELMEGVSDRQVILDDAAFKCLSAFQVALRDLKRTAEEIGKDSGCIYDAYRAMRAG